VPVHIRTGHRPCRIAPMGLLSRAEMEPPKLLGQRVDDTAASHPDRLWAEILLSTSPVSILSVDYSLLSSTLARVAALIESDVGPRALSTDQLTLWYSGPSDIRYPIFLLACSKLGHKVTLEIHRQGIVR
jgi:hypothetical protein